MPALGRRPYSAKHRAQREHLIPYAINTYCPIDGPTCIGLMTNPKRMDLGHIIPVWQGGSDDITNKQAECVPCNRGKGAREGNRLRGNRASRDW